MRSEIVVPFSFMPDVRPGKVGPIFELRYYTIKPGTLQGINIPGMTMSFLVKDKAMLSNLQPLQKVNFELTYDGKQYLITNIK